MVKLYYRKPRKRSQESYGAVVGWLVDCNEEGVRFAPAAAREEVAAWLGFALEPLCCQLLPAKASAYMIRNEDLPCQPRLFIASVGDNFYWSGVTPGRVCWFADGCGQQTSFASLARLQAAFQALGKLPGRPCTVPTTRAAPCTRCPRKIDL